MTRILKDSGVAWINKIPENWNVKKIKYTLINRNENNNPIKSRDILSLTAKQGVIPLDEKEGGGNKPKEDFSNYKLAYPGDIVINSMNILSGSVGLSKYFGCVSPVYYMLRPKDENDDVRFFNYIFQTKVFQLSLLGLGNGILMKESDNGKFNTIRMRIPLDKFGNLFIPLPDSDEQKKISDFLEMKGHEIDLLCSDIERQIEKLDEYKESIITKIVTTGINKINVKDSGIEWMGAIPDNWEIKRVKYLFKEISNPCINGDDYDLLSVSEYYGVAPRNEKIEDGEFLSRAESLDGYKICHKNDIVMNIMLAWKRALGISNYTGIVSPAYCVYRAINQEETNSKYYHYLFRTRMYTNIFRQYSRGIIDSRLRLYPDKFGSLWCHCPPKVEQEKIVEYLDKKCSEIDLLIEEKEKQLNILEEYKKSLIYEYVTGKKEVPSNY